MRALAFSMTLRGLLFKALIYGLEYYVLIGTHRTHTFYFEPELLQEKYIVLILMLFHLKKMK